MSEERIVYIVIDPSRARSGARAVVNSLNNIERATQNINTQLRSSGSHMQGFSRNFGRLQALLLTAQPVRFLTGFVRSLVEADRTIMAFKSQMYTVTGELDSAGESFDYLKDTAMAYAVPLNSLTKGFAKLKSSMNTPELAQYNEALFQSTVILSSVLHLAEYNSERVFNVMIQIMSKGQLMMEELKQQLGEHVPGAVALAAEAMGMSVRDMMDRMQKGLISAEEFAAGWSRLIIEKFGPATDIATKSITAAINRFNNVMTTSMITLTQNEAGFALAKVITSIVDKIDDSGEYFEVFGRKIAEVALRIDDFINSITPEDIEDFLDSTVKLYEAIINIGGAIASGILFLAKYSEHVTILAKVMFGAWVASKAFTASMYFLGPALLNAGVLAKAAAISIGSIAAAMSLVAGAFIGYSIGSYLYDEYAVVRKVGNQIAKYFTFMATLLVQIYEKMGLRIKLAFSSPMAYIRMKVSDLLQFLNDAGESVMKFFGITPDTRDNLLKVLSRWAGSGDAAKIEGQLEALAKTHDSQLKNIIESYDDLYSYIDEEMANTPNTEELNARLGLPPDFQERMKAMRDELQKFAEAEKKIFDSSGGGTDEKALEKLIADEQALRNSLETRKETIVRNYKETQNEIDRIVEARNLSENEWFDLSLRNYQQYQEQMVAYNEEMNRKREEADTSYWGNMLRNMEKALTTGEELTTNMLDRFTQGVGDAVEDMVFEFTTFEDAFKGILEQMLRALVNVLAQMAAQWVAYQLIQAIVGKSAAATSAVAQTSQAAATQQYAGLAAFASTAAIPLVGPAMAPAAYAAAITATSPMVAAIASLSAGAAAARAQGGQVLGGQTYLVGERGPELFTAGGTGHITPNSQLPSNNSTNVTQVFQMSDNARREARQAVMEAAPYIKQLAKQAILEASQQGGSISKALGRRS